MKVNSIIDVADERIVILHKFEDILACALGILPRIRKSHDLCLDGWGPSAVLGNKEVTDAFIAVRNRGAKIRLITEITDANLAYCKEFMEFAEVRHLDKVKGNFSVSDLRWYTASAVAEKDKPPSRLIFSTVKEFAEQHQYFFETLWSKSVPAEQRIGEIEGKAIAERTEIVHGEEDSINLLLQVTERAKKEAVACSSSIVPIFCMTAPLAKQKIIEAKNRGVYSRQITDITGENLAYCKEFMKYVELRHMNNVQGNMMLTDNNEYVAAASVGASSVPQAIYSNARAIIEQQRLFFENLWSKSVPAEQRIREIEEGIETIDTQIVEGNDEIDKKIVRSMETSSELLLCTQPGGMQLIHSRYLDHFKKVSDKAAKGQHEGIKCLTTIDKKEDIDFVKRFIDLGVVVRHVPSIVTFNFAVTDKTVNATIEEMKGGKMVHSMLTSNEPNYVKHFRAMFENFWSKAIPAEQRLRDIEEGLPASEIEIIVNSAESVVRGYDLLKNARKEVLLFFGTPNTVLRAVNNNVLESYRQFSERGIRVKLLVPVNDAILPIVESMKEKTSSMNNIEIKTINAELDNRLSLMIVDKQYLMMWEIRDDKELHTTVKALGIAEYSNSGTIVGSYLRIFESLWKQSELYEQLQMHDRMQEEFINIAAHELRTPIQPILGTADLLQSALGGQDKIEVSKDEIELIIRNAKRLERLSSDILTISRIESESLTLNKESVNLQDKIQNVISDAMPLIKDNSDLKVVFEQHPQPIFVEADLSKVYEVLSNLLRNAIKFTKRGSITVSLRKEKDEQDGKWYSIIGVKDTGIGIDSGIMPRLFEKFATKGEMEGGTGLGLFISKSIVEAHGGKIWAENNRDGNGATFTFSLPIKSN